MDKGDDQVSLIITNISSSFSVGIYSSFFESIKQSNDVFCLHPEGSERETD